MIEVKILIVGNYIIISNYIDRIYCRKLKTKHIMRTLQTVIKIIHQF